MLDSSIEHIGEAQSTDALVVAPATANVLAKFAHGLADDFLTTLYLATRAPVIVAPAMNVNMWEHPATQANMETLESRGVRIVPPESGPLACGMTGSGRLAEPGDHCARRCWISSIAAMIWPGKLFWSLPAERGKPSTRSVSWAIAPAARWAMPWPRRRSAGARA